MLILALESSAKAASCAITSDNVLLAESFLNNGMTHSRTLTSMAEAMLRQSGLCLQDINTIAVASGPGSFTGIRIGVSAAKGLAWGDNKPCIGISTLEAMAYCCSDVGSYVIPVMDARRNQVYTASFSCISSPVRIAQDRAISLDELFAHLAEIDGPKLLVGDGAELCYQNLSGKVPDLIIPGQSLRWQRASGVALAAFAQLQNGASADAEALTPNYLRLSQAERERNARLMNSKQE